MAQVTKAPTIRKIYRSLRLCDMNDLDNLYILLGRSEDTL